MEVELESTTKVMFLYTLMYSAFWEHDNHIVILYLGVNYQCELTHEKRFLWYE